ncbi:hypothetical protein V8C35DRAFT_231057 [Trichoderma chlorosporum]
MKTQSTRNLEIELSSGSVCKWWASSQDIVVRFAQAIATPSHYPITSFCHLHLESRAHPRSISRAGISLQGSIPGAAAADLVGITRDRRRADPKTNCRNRTRASETGVNSNALLVTTRRSSGWTWAPSNPVASGGLLVRRSSPLKKPSEPCQSRQNSLWPPSSQGLGSVLRVSTVNSLMGPVRDASQAPGQHFGRIVRVLAVSLSVWRVDFLHGKDWTAILIRGRPDTGPSVGGLEARGNQSE